MLLHEFQFRRRLRRARRDIDFLNNTLLVRASKTEAGERMIPMNNEIHDTILGLRERARKFDGTDAKHYVFPACERGHIDSTRHQKSFRTAWRNLTRAIQCPSCGTLQRPGDVCIAKNCRGDIKDIKSPLAGLRFHDLRHHAITELAESQVSDQAIMAIAGHVSPRMLARHSHVRTEARRQAVSALSAKASTSRFWGGKGVSYDTRNDTKRGECEAQFPEVVENMVGPNGLEPLTSTVSKARE
jgi:integrase